VAVITPSPPASERRLVSPYVLAKFDYLGD
jgi:hypothetical protein